MLLEEDFDQGWMRNWPDERTAGQDGTIKHVISGVNPRDPERAAISSKADG